MSSFIERLISDDFVWNAIVSNHVGRRKRQSSGGFGINCPLCINRGESPDTRQRCGIKPEGGGVTFHCFNCGQRGKWRPGETLSKSMQDLLKGVGVSEIEVQRLNHKAFTYKSMFQKSPEAMLLFPEAVKPTFATTKLPDGARSFEEWALSGETGQDFIDVATYLYGRGDEIANGATYYWTPETKFGMHRRVIIPLTFEGRITGYTARAIDPEVRRYQMDSQPNYLYNMAALTAAQRKFVILVEGIFDAIAIDGVGLLGARLNAQQAAWIKSQGKTVILVPDRDTRGASLIDTALENGWRVAFPATKFSGGSWWDDGVKDCADAVKRYGKAWTLLSVIESSTDNKLEINMKRKYFV